MKTTLYFEGPSDLSVGTIRIERAGDRIAESTSGSIAEWIATPDNRSFHSEHIEPGMYSTEIAPVGSAPQSVIFEVQAGKENRIILPSFSALSSSGGNTNFLNKISRSKYADLNEGGRADSGARVNEKESAGARHVTPLDISPQKSRISVGLSEERRGRETFDTFRGKVDMNVFGGRIELTLPDDPRRDPWAGDRVRLSVAIEDVRIERCLLPLYRGGTNIVLTTSPFASADLELTVTPVDPNVRALLRVLDGGNSATAAAVRDNGVLERLTKTPFDNHSDPWVAMLIGLLSIRFPAVFPVIEPAWGVALTERADWAFDTHVIRASQVLNAAWEKGEHMQQSAVTAVVAMFGRAQVAGSPYYRSTNQLFADLASGIATYLKNDPAGIDMKTVQRFERIHSRWYRELPLQRGTGATFTWLSRDAVALKKRQVLIPNRQPSGRLPERGTSVVFKGELSAGGITLLPMRVPRARRARDDGAPRPAADAGAHDELRARLPTMPAWSRAIDDPDDPNRYRFGGQATSKGFGVRVSFAPGASPDWATVVLTVEAPRSEEMALDDVAWFFLHPTFSPTAAKVNFQGRRAELTLQVWGGFTVGVWLPRVQVELECDLARSTGAPQIIRTR